MVMERALKERLNLLGQKILTASRDELYVSMRFFESVLNRLSYQMNVSVQRFATDGQNFYFNPKYLLELYNQSPATVNRAYLHSLMHCLFRHLFRMPQEMKSQQSSVSMEGELDAGRLQPERWNLACDIAVESVMDSLEFPCILSFPSDFRTEVYRILKEHISVLTAEGIYHYLNTLFSEGDLIRMQEEFTVDDHNFWNVKHQGNSSQEETQQEERRRQQLEAAWEETAKKTQTAMETFYRHAGDKAGSLKTALAIKNRRVDDYSAFLRQFAVVKEEICLDMDSFDYIPYYFGLNGYQQGREPVVFLEPLEYKERQGIDEFVIAIDTSGSVSLNQIQAFLEITFSILESEETFFRKITLHVIQCDAEIQNDTIIRNREDIEALTRYFPVSGFGGTDFRPVFSYIERLLAEGAFTRLRGLLYFTDGFGTYPERGGNFETVFVIPAEQEAEPKIPAWAMKVFLKI